MKSIILVAFALVAVAVAAPTEKVDEILASNFEQQPDGSYQQGFETSNGIKVEETGELKEALDEDNKPHTVVVSRGSYSYPDPDGVIQQIVYFADETGFHPEGPSIPKVPAA